jgi:hypothetical protein
MRSVRKKLKVPVVNDVNVLRELFNDPNLEMIDHHTYRRTLHDGTEVSETVFGNPALR